MLKNKVLRYICGVLAGLSFVMMTGAAEASNIDTITFAHSIIQGVLSSVAFVVFLKLAGAFEPYIEIEDEETELNTQELFRQIHRHTPIDGYRVFTECFNDNI